MESITSNLFHQQERISKTISWNEYLQSWIALDPAIALSILKSGTFLVTETAERLSQVAARGSVEIPEILAALRDAPLAHNGDEHKRARRQFAANLAPRMNAAADAFRQACASQLPLILHPGQSAELFGDLLVPAMNTAVTELGGNEISLETFSVNSPTQLFSSTQKLSGSRLKMLEQEISTPHKKLAPEKRNAQMTLFAGDPTLGSLGESLIDGIRSNPGLRLCDIPWSDGFTRTSVTFTERIASCDTEIAGVQVKKGDLVILYLGAFEAASQLHFGAGAHRCLGEALAKMLWDSLRAGLKTRQEKLEIEHVEYRAADFVFSMPLSIRVKVTI